MDRRGQLLANGLAGQGRAGNAVKLIFIEDLQTSLITIMLGYGLSAPLRAMSARPAAWSSSPRCSSGAFPRISCRSRKVCA